jgi:hypothetical protein
VRCNIDTLDARGDTDSNYIEACRLKEALLDATVPTRSISGYWIDENKKPILAYFGDSNGQENAHSVPVSCFIFMCLYLCAHLDYRQKFSHASIITPNCYSTINRNPSENNSMVVTQRTLRTKLSYTIKKVILRPTLNVKASDMMSRSGLKRATFMM